MRNLGSLTVIFALWLGLVLGCTSPRNKVANLKSVTSEQREAIKVSLKGAGYPMADTLEFRDSYRLTLVATFTIHDPVSPRSLKTFSEESLLAIREAMLPFKMVEAYQVTLYGPSSGTGLVRYYGVAAFSEEGGAVDWVPVYISPY